MNEPGLFQQKSRGIVLLMVLGVLGLMALLAVSFLSITGLERSISRNYVDHTRAQMLAESGIEKAIAQISKYYGVLSSEQLQNLIYNPGDPSAPLDEATLPTGAIDIDGDGLIDAASGVVGPGSYTPNGDVYRLRITDNTARLNINLSPWLRGIAAAGEDPERLSLTRVYTYPFTDADIDISTDVGLKAMVYVQRVHNNLRQKINLLVDTMGLSLEPGATYSDVGEAILVRRDAQGPFQRMSELGRFLVDEAKILSRENYRRLATNLTVLSWEDPNVIAPNPPDFYQPGMAKTDVFRYTDVQSMGYELSPRAPVNINTASRELIQVLLTGLTGYYLEENPARHDAAYHENPYAWYTWGLSYFTNTNISYTTTPRFRDTERAPAWTAPFSARYGKVGEAAITATKADEMAGLLYNRIHINDNPIETWQEFRIFVRSLSDYYDSTLTPNTAACPLDKYQADLILAAANPNTDSNDVNPNTVVFQYIDKNDLLQGPTDADLVAAPVTLSGFTTEFCFESTGIYTVESLGLISDDTTAIITRYEIAATVKLFDVYRITTQEQFTAGVIDQGAIYSANNGIMNTAGQGIVIDAEDALGLPVKSGVAWQSYPEPRRIKTAPDDTPVLPYRLHASQYDGYLMLATLQADDLPLDPPSAAPTFRQSFNQYHYAPMQRISYTDEYGRSRVFPYHWYNFSCDKINATFRFGGASLLVADFNHLPNMFDPYIGSSSPYTVGENPREDSAMHNAQRPDEPGNRFPDGGFSEGKEGFSYIQYLNAFGNWGMQGTVFFWVKPCWQPELAERDRSFMNLSTMHKSNHPNSWWINGCDRANFQIRNTFVPEHLNTYPWKIDTISSSEYYGPTKPQGKAAKHSFEFFAAAWSINVFPYDLMTDGYLWPGMGNLFGGVVKNSPIANRIGFSNAPAPTTTYPDFKFRGREWAMMAHSWNMWNLTNYEIQIAINGILVDNFDNSRVNWKGNGFASTSTNEDHYDGESFNLMINDDAMDYGSGASFDLDPYYYSSSVSLGSAHGNNVFNTMRFGGQSDDPAGYSADSTYDEILCFQTGPVDPDGMHTGFDKAGLESPYLEGRYYNMRDAVYTSPGIDVYSKLGLSSLQNVTVRSISYTAYWPLEVGYQAPRYDRPADVTYPLVPSIAPTSLDGGNATDKPDPLDSILEFGYKDPIRVNLGQDAGGITTWHFDAADTTQWMTYAGGMQVVDNTGLPMTLKANANLHVRILLAGGTPGDPLYTSPVIDDITIAISTDTKVLRWEVIQK